MGHWDVAIVAENKIGSLAEVGEALGKAGINIEGLWAHGGEGEHLHVLVTDAEAAERVASDRGWRVHKSHEVLVVPAENRPGWLGEQTRRLADAGLNVEWCYLATDNRIALSVKDLAKAREIWQSARSTAN